MTHTVLGKGFDGNAYGGQDDPAPRPESINPTQAVEAFRDAIEAAGLGIELNPAYAAMAERRIHGAAGLLVAAGGEA